MLTADKLALRKKNKRQEDKNKCGEWFILDQTHTSQTFYH